MYQQDTGTSMHVSNGLFDMQFCVKRLSEMMTKPQKLGNLRLAWLARCLVGTQKLTLRFDHQEYSDIVRVTIDSDWAGSEERYSTRAGLEFHGGHLVDSLVASDRVPEKQISTESWMALTRSTCSRRWDEPSQTDSTAAIGMCSWTGVGKTRHIQVRCLWI